MNAEELKVYNQYTDIIGVEPSQILFLPSNETLIRYEDERGFQVIRDFNEVHYIFDSVMDARELMW